MVRPGIALSLAVALSAACAARGPSPQVLAEMAKAESLVRQGCHTCLTEALAIYERNAALKQAPPGAARGAFDAAVLLAVREKELGIPGDAYGFRAVELAKRVPVTVPVVKGKPVPVSIPPQTVLDAAALVTGETSGLDPEMRGALNRGRLPLEPNFPRRRALDAALETDLAARYVALTIDCEQPKLIENVDMKALAAQYEAVPLMKFRLARCGRPTLAPKIADLRTGDPRWTDTLFWEARAALVPQAPAASKVIVLTVDYAKAIGLFTQAHEAFPTSLLVTMAWSQTNLAIEEYDAALSGFDEVLAKFPEHRDALIGRVTALSYLMRHPEAIASATRILELGTWHIGDANYWRAWNHYNLKDYEQAWTDVENAIKGLSNSRVYMLAGLIAYARKDLPTAILRFDRSYEIDSSNCDATWMSGLVSIDQEDLKLAAPKFTRGMSCFRSSAAALRRNLADTEAGIAARGTPATAREQRQMDRLKRDSENADERSAQSAFNAAQCLARLGDKSQALTHVDVAANHPRMREKALALKAAIEKLPN